MIFKYLWIVMIFIFEIVMWIKLLSDSKMIMNILLIEMIKNSIEY